ncbi:hypothetical protein E2C01_036105 [Portunus trituberculatus]|uniref:Uncharacterized protein n=1 Tax=Portunus trituberculatus TaxID=210409 RepID=A0A5B7FBJ6_PORTR|nr:hypothetical protein [Portunus trituberculatus]
MRALGSEESPSARIRILSTTLSLNCDLMNFGNMRLLSSMDVYHCPYTMKDNLYFLIKHYPPWIWMVRLAVDSAGGGVILLSQTWTRAVSVAPLIPTTGTGLPTHTTSYPRIRLRPQPGYQSCEDARP